MTSRQRRRQRRRGGVRSKLLFAAGGLLAVAVGAMLALGGWFLSVADDAPPLSQCKQRDDRGNTVLLAADGSRLGYVRSDVARAPVPLDRIGRNLRRSTVAIEDQRFYRHNGVDYEGGLRALLENLSAGKVVQGGSTITMQLMRSLCFKHPQRTIERKAQEAKLAVEYEQHHSKAEILDSYLNSASYGTVDGRTAVGVQAASRIYFSRPASRLSVEQAALLAGLPQAPSEYNPLLHPASARQRRNQVLAKMADLGYISRARSSLAEQRGLGLRPSDAYTERHEPYFFDYVEEALIARYGVEEVRDGGLRVQTTIEPRFQEVGRGAIASALPYSTDPAGALVAIDPRNGHIRAMASSGSYDADQFNLAAQSHRQPGSTFKMFVLTTALKQGIDPYHTYYTSKPLSLDLPEWGHWDVHTADEGYMGTVNLQQATVASDNTVFAQLDLDVGPQNVARTARSMGVTSKLDGIPAEGLGGLRVGVSPLEMADAFATLASGGIHRNPVAISKVVFPGGRVEHPEQPDPRRVLPANVAYEVTRILHDNITSGTGTAAYTGCYGQAGKTGTTDRYVDAWFDGYQPNLATSVWVGYPQSNEIEMSSVHGITVFGGTFPADIWNAFYSGTGVPCQYFRVPAEPVSWAPFTGSYTASAPTPRKPSGKPQGAEGTGGGGGGGGYDPDAYAPGAGAQQPAPVPAPAPAPAPPPPPAPDPQVGGGGNAGAGGDT
jgi:penicillin-binding protein 1A